MGNCLSGVTRGECPSSIIPGIRVNDFAARAVYLHLTPPTAFEWQLRASGGAP